MGIQSIDYRWEEEARIQQTQVEWRAWLNVIMARDDDGPAEMARDPRFVPFLPYRPHPKYAKALVKECYPRRSERGANVWLVEVTYSTDVDVTQNPLGMPAEISLDTELRDVPAIFDVDGNPVINTAGDLLTDPPAVRKIVDRTISITKNIPIALPAWIQTHPGSVNRANVVIRGMTWPAGTLFFAKNSIGPEQNVPGATDTISTLRGSPYCTTSLELWYRADGWVEFYPNRGFFQLVPVNPQQKFSEQKVGDHFITAQTARALNRKLPPYERRRCTVGPLQDAPPEPVFLDANGQMIVNPTAADILAIAYDGFPKLAWNGVLPLK